MGIAKYAAIFTASAVAIFASTVESHAACQCACVNGQMQPLCSVQSTSLRSARRRSGDCPALDQADSAADDFANRNEFVGTATGAKPGHWSIRVAHHRQ